MRVLPSTAAAAVLLASLGAQSNTIPGLDGSLTNNASPSYFGRRGSYPTGEVAMCCSYTMCNPGTVPIQWTAPMNANHPMFAMSVVRESNGRFEQITNSGTTYVKHAFGAANAASTCGGTCQTTGSGLRVNCSDTYGASTNANRYYLGPASEIDPWTGIWNPVGSYFDRGDPDVGAPQNTDGVRSLQSTSGGFSTDAVKNRVTLREQDLLAPGTLYYCCHIVVRGEDGDLHWNNLGSRQMTATWGGSQWTFAVPGAFAQGSVLNRWTGAAVSNARNGEDDGHFVVAVKVTQLDTWTWHYEYAVQNFDNARGGATLRLPMHSTTTVTNITFRDTNTDPLDDWTTTRTGTELIFQATATNPLDWNNIYNFGFDCNVAPDAGNVAIDQARVGPGALSVAIATQVPSGIALVTDLGPGCGSPPPVLDVNAAPFIPSPGFAFTIDGAPSATIAMFASFGPIPAEIVPGCFVYLASPISYGVFFADAAGHAVAPFPIANDVSMNGLAIDWQAAEVVAAGPLWGFLELSNGLEILISTP
jgi:hypothetical protein